MNKIIIDGHGGHLCEASLNATGIRETGESVEEAIGRLIRFHSKECGFEIEILPCSTTAYEKSGLECTGKVVCPRCEEERYMANHPCYKCGSYEDVDNNNVFKQSDICKTKQLALEKRKRKWKLKKN